jgi:hypothetical protein
MARNLKCAYQRLTSSATDALLKKGCEPSEDAVIAKWAPCKNLTAVRAFLGTAESFEYSSRTTPSMLDQLQRLTRKDQPFEWGPEQEKAMEYLKNAVILPQPFAPLITPLPTP